MILFHVLEHYGTNEKKLPLIIIKKQTAILTPYPF